VASTLRAVDHDGTSYNGQLLQTNVSHLVGDRNERAIESRGQLEKQIRRLDAVREGLRTA
jgi:hypothetical protein